MRARPLTSDREVTTEPAHPCSDLQRGVVDRPDWSSLFSQHVGHES